MAFHLLTDKGEVFIRITVNSLISADLEKAEIKRRQEGFTKSIEFIIENYSHATSAEIN